MSDLDTIQKIWEIWTEAFDKVDNEEKKEWFNNLIEELDNTEAINRLKKQWDSVSEEEKLKLYKRWAIKMSASLKKAPILTYYRAINNTRKGGIKSAAKIALLEQIPCRFLIELWILQKPESLTNEKLIKDIKKDAKNFNTYLSICSTVCACIPEARPAVPLIKMAKHYTKRYEKHWTETLAARLKVQEKDEKDKIATNTQEELSYALAA